MLTPPPFPTPAAVCSATLIGTFPTKKGGADYWTDFEAIPEAYIANDELNTSMAKRLAEFEKDPCGMNEDPPRGMCARPGICICACLKYINVDYDGDGNNDRSIPWSDTWFRRPWLQPAGYVAGTEACISGWEGHKNAQGQFVSCHLSALRFLHAVQQLARFTFVPPYCSSPPPHLLFLLLAPSLYPPPFLVRKKFTSRHGTKSKRTGLFSPGSRRRSSESHRGSACGARSSERSC